MRSSPTRWLVAALIATLLFEAGAVAPAFVLGSIEPTNATGQIYLAPETSNSVPLAIPQPVAPIHIEGVPGEVVPGLGAAVRPDAVPYAAPSTPEEVAGLRSEFGRVVAEPDGTFTAEYFLGRVNYLDEASSWQPIDLSLVEDATSPYGLRTAANSFDLRVSATGTGDQLAELSLGGRVIRVRQLMTAVGPPTVTDDGAHYPAPPGRGAISLIPTPEGLDFTVTLEDVSQAGTYQFVLDTGGLTAESGPDGQGVRLRDATGAVVATVSPPSVYDANERSGPRNMVTTQLSGLPLVAPNLPPPPSVVPSPSVEPSLSLPIPAPTLEVAGPGGAPSPTPDASTPGLPSPLATDLPATPEPTPMASPTDPPATAEPTPTAAPTDPVGLGPNEVLLSYTIDPAWLAEPDRAFPVVLDPTICIQKGQTVADDGCDELSSSTGYLDHFLTSGNPYGYPYNWTVVRVGTDAQNDGFDFQKQRALFYFPNATLPDGGQLTNATLRLRQNENFGSSQQIYFSLITKGWNAQTTWNGQPTYGATTAAQAVLSSAAVPGDLSVDVTSLARSWYTRNPNDWKPNLGLMARFVTETQNEVNFRNKAFNTIDLRPRLALTYVLPKVSVAFDTTTLGADFVPSTMPAGTTIGLPVKITNDGSGFSFNNSGTDHYELGYRWFDAIGRPVAQTGFTNWGTVALAASVANNATSGVISLPVTTPPQVGQYSLRLDLAHKIGADYMWASDWSQPSLYYSGAKASTNTSNTRVVGSSVIEKSEFSVAVVGGGGTAFGETKTVGLADGSSLGVNLWSRNVRFDGVGGVGFEDLAGPFGVSYFYDSANRSDCSGVLKACGWGTNFDEGFRPAVPGTDYVYVDAAGNRYLVGTTGSGQLVSSAGVRLERVRHTLLDENWMSGATWADAWSGTDPTKSTTYAYPGNPSGEHSYKIDATNTAGTATSTFTQVDLDHYPLMSFAIKGVTATKGAIGFEISNETLGTTDWLAYTVGGTSPSRACPRSTSRALSAAGSRPRCVTCGLMP